MSKAELLTDDQWPVLEPLFHEERTGSGRPQLHSDREVLNGVLWVLRTGVREALNSPIFSNARLHIR